MNETTIKLPESGVTVTLSYRYGDQRAIEGATLPHVTWDAEESDGKGKATVDDLYVSERIRAILTAIPKSWDKKDLLGVPVPLSMDTIDELSIMDGKALFEACSNLVNEKEKEIADVAKQNGPKGKN